MNNHERLVEELYTALGGMKRVILRSREQMLGSLQLTRTQIEVIMLLGEARRQTIGELASRLAVSHSASTQTVETLVKRGLVERDSDSSDRRIVHASLSAEGRQLAARLHADRLARMKAALAGLSDEELRLMTDVLQRLTRQFEQQPQQQTQEGADDQ